MTTPLFEHDCADCIYLGQHNGSDLYYHPGELYIETVIARHSSVGRDYSSGLSFSQPYTDITGKTQTGIPELVEARNRAIHAGLLSRRPDEHIRKTAQNDLRHTVRRQGLHAS